jgi:hypothetical protein
MSNVQTQRERAGGRSTDLLSIILALVGTVLAISFLWGAPSWEPTVNKPFWYASSVWAGFIYVVVQIVLLLMAPAVDVRTIGVLDSILSIIPVVAGFVTLIVWFIVPERLPLSPFNINLLWVVIIAGAAEFLLTIWIRFVINRRTFGFGDGH